MRLWYRFLIVLIVIATLTACGPSEEQKAQWAEQSRLSCLENICEGDVVPERDWTKESVFKRGGKWFIAPTKYGTGAGGFAFYWPSKTPGVSSGDFPEKPQVVSGKADQVSIEFFIEAKEHQGDMYELIERDRDQRRILTQETLKNGLERITRLPESNSKFPNSVLYVATNERTTNGKPPVLSCNEDATHWCTTGLAWKPGFRIYVRFDQKHASDWPEIYQEIMYVISLIREP